MGVGDTLEAALPLAAPLPAGRWHLIGDGIVLMPVDMQFDVLRRRAASDTRLCSFTHHFDPAAAPNQFDATRYEDDADGIAADFTSGDELVLRFTAAGTPMTGDPPAFIPNGDGANAHGRIPSLTLPSH